MTDCSTVLSLFGGTLKRNKMTTTKIMETQFFLLASLATIVYHVCAEEMSDGGNEGDENNNHVVDNNEQSNDDDYEMGGDDDALTPTWMTTLHHRIREIASVWSSRVVVAIAVIVIYDLFSPERRQRRRKELEERQRLRQEQQQQEQQQKKLKDRQEDGSTYSNQTKNEDNEIEPKVFQGTSYKLNDEEPPNGLSSSSRANSTLQEKDVGQKKQNRFLDRLEQEQNHLVEEKTEETSDDETKSEEKQKPSSAETKKKTKRHPPLPQTQQQRPLPPPRMKATNKGHPGMTEFSYWYDVETSLFRIYTLTRKDKQEVLLPYVPNSRRGNVSIFLNVKNSTNHTIKVFWVDFTGKHVLKGTIKPNYTWEQTTYIDHPWVFEDAHDEQPYLYYVPYRAIATLPTAQTLSPDGETAMHKFTLVPSKPNDDFLIGVQDDIMPHPGIVHFHQPLLGITWVLTHMSRMMSTDDPRVDTLQKYLKNIMDDPAPVKYRQIRIASKNFAPIWQSPMRGLLHAIGFVEVGAYAELGCADGPLSRDRVQEVALLSYLLTQWRFKPTSDSQLQPDGALDGYGRAGFGRAGSAN